MKRSLNSIDERGDSSDDDDDLGPMPVPGSIDTKVISKKQRKLKFEKVFVDRLPCSDSYEYSYMHRDIVNHVGVSKKTDYIVTGSVDGHVKFWKKMHAGIEFVKHFQVRRSSLQV